MPAIPEFVLRKLFVPGSLQPIEEGFTFELNNSLAPVTLTGLSVTSDGNLCVSGFLFVSLPELGEMPAAGISEESPFHLPMRMVIKVRVNAPMPQRQLVVRAETREAGVLQFNIPLENIKESSSVGTTSQEDSKSLQHASLFTKLSRRFQYASQVFRVQQDPQHPVLHFAPPANWINDPNGLFFWKGTYHLFYQYNPFEPAWGNIHWGHAVSHDMMHWKHQPVALVPSQDGFDAGGCFSGCAVINKGVPTLIYTGVYPENQCLATGVLPDLKVWRKHPQPVIPNPPQGMDLEGFRDPCVWRHENEWRMVVGSGIRGEGGAVLLYRSTDLLDWQYMGILFRKDPNQRDIIWTGTMWECPSFFQLGTKWVLILSAYASEGGMNTIYYVGDFLNDHFIPDGDPRQLDYGVGSCFYAPQTFEDGLSRRIMFGWIREARDPEVVKAAGWSGAISLPRILSLSDERQLISSPLDTLKKLRAENESLMKSGQFSSLVYGACFEGIVKIPPTVDRWSGIDLTPGKKADEHILIGLDHMNSAVVVDCRKAGGMINIMPVTMPDIDEVSLHVFVDGSILEVFVDDALALSARFYVKKPQSLHVRLVGDAYAELWNLKL